MDQIRYRGRKKKKTDWKGIVVPVQEESLSLNWTNQEASLSDVEA